MLTPAVDAGAPGQGAGAFASTHWSAVLAVAQGGGEGAGAEAAESALAELCTAYWRPLYAFVRRKGWSPAEAEDLTQEFFAQRVVTLLVFRGVVPGRGRFRGWLLSSFQHFLNNEHDRRRAWKRGGRQEHVSWDSLGAEAVYAFECTQDETPEKSYERVWVRSVLERALDILRVRGEAAYGGATFRELAVFLPGKHDPPAHAEVARRLGKTETAMRMAVRRLRREYGRILREEIRRTVSDEAEVAEELRYLLGVVGEMRG